jgi:DNA-binding response OmpR family regulator
MKNILLVEDDPFLIDIYTTRLGAEGFNLLVAKEGEEALAIAKERQPVLVLLDIVLPNIDGWAVLKKIREISGMKGCKIIILSNLGQREEIQKGLNLGADKYLIKSDFTPSQVVEEIKQIL